MQANETVLGVRLRRMLQLCVLVVLAAFGASARTQSAPASNATRPRPSDVTIGQLRATRQILGMGDASEIHFTLDNRNPMIPIDWEMTCSHVDIEKWKSSLPIRILKNDKVTGKPKIIGGAQFTPGKSVTVHVRRAPDTKDAETGTCRITATAVFGSKTPPAPTSHTSRTVTFNFR